MVDQETGVVFRAHDGRRSSQAAGKRVFADAVRGVDAGLAHEIENEDSWRKRYLRYVRLLVELGARSAKDALRIANDGIASLHDNLSFVRDQEELSIDQAYDAYAGEAFRTATVEGAGTGVHSLLVPYRGRLLHGDDLRRQLDAWEAARVIEPSCAQAVRTVADNPEWLELSDQTFVLLGAASEMGPLEPLSKWGATIVAVDVPRRDIWERIVGIATAGGGRLYAPVNGAAEDADALLATAGADVLRHGPEIRTWIGSFDGPLTIMDLVYSDGGTFVRLVAAIDGLVASLLDRRDDLALAYLGTPTDVYAVPGATAAAARAAASERPAAKLLRMASAGRAYRRRYADLIASEEGPVWGISDCIVPQQGPNYILAKNAQRWRALSARDQGIPTSANVAPAAFTRSVVKNRVLKAAYAGAGSFGVEVFAPDTSRALMAALLVHDLRNHSTTRDALPALRHPFELHASCAAHGGIWALPYEPRSVLPLAVVKGMATPRRR